MFQISLMQNAFAPQASELQIVYKQSAFTYNLTSLVHMFFHIPISFPANFIVDKYGTKAGNTIACILTLTGSWLRLLINKNFNYAILGQVFVGIANPFIVNSMNKISNNWFYPIQRPIITGILSFSSIITGVIGLVIPGIYFQSYQALQDKKYSYQTGKNLTFKLLFYQALIVSFIVFLNFYFFCDKPKTPPSYCSFQKREPFIKSLKILIINKTYIFISIAFSSVYGTFIVLSVILDQILNPFGFFSSHTSLIGAIFVFSGLLGTVYFLNELKNENNYLYLLKKLTFCGILSLVSFQSILFSQIFILVCLPTFTLGFFVIPLIPIILELANEVCFPIGEAVITGFIYSISHIMGFLLGMGFSVIIQKFEGEKIGSVFCCLGFILLFLIAFISIFFIKQTLKRTQFEKKPIQRKRQVNFQEVYFKVYEKQNNNIYKQYTYINYYFFFFFFFSINIFINFIIIYQIFQVIMIFLVLLQFLEHPRNYISGQLFIIYINRQNFPLIISNLIYQKFLFFHLILKFFQIQKQKIHQKVLLQTKKNLKQANVFKRRKFIHHKGQNSFQKSHLYYIFQNQKEQKTSIQICRLIKDIFIQKQKKKMQKLKKIKILPKILLKIYFRKIFFFQIPSQKYNQKHHLQ
ncbi:major facilitator superfamily protein, putative [Ichthyophthirius multifiliis]|uniref:Major facilitator superfamily protein, putative n=1 Tax=Ichthyophthirius multifiliis TaxID=5932 RepID=G0QQ56_ICHMU|nr:major facilitator superfamily protein, putative [Ichthyophthirius multifiliis]EGR32652.1 major facilitator superfamily protein, putative [Ichthyophthirius multifiliis]|eukprot:XP_004036638.1 major facilitator superfamily protein, putative [Ichthyophthirius multifiliis]